MFKILDGSKGKYRLDETGLIQRKRKDDSWVDLKQHTNGKGYPSVSVAGKGYYLHRLVASMFVSNPNYLEYTIVHHKDEDITNYKASNLEWTDQTGHIGLHMLNEQVEINKVSNNRQVMLGVRPKLKARLNKARGSATVDGYINYLLDLAEEV